MEEIINDDQVDDDNDAAIAGALAAAVTPMQSSRRREGDRHQTGTGRGRSGGAGRGRGGGTGRGRGGRGRFGNTSKQQNWTYFLQFMRWLHSTNYGKDISFTNDQLNAITPDDVVRYMKFKVYGDANADEDQAYPTEGRSSSLEQYKKSISKFMLSSYPYNDEHNTGNPTRSKRVNTIVNIVKKCEVQGNGKESQARKPFNEKEFVRIMNILEQSDNVANRLFCSAVYRYQLAMGARIDDTFKLSKRNIKANTDPTLESLSLVTKLCWSKNVMDEQDGTFIIISILVVIIESVRRLTLLLLQFTNRFC